MKPHSVNYFVSIISLTGLLLLTLIGVNMVSEIKKVEQTFVKTHQDSAHNELERGINAVLAKANEIADKLADWDESSQQLSDPTYYRFWRQRRVHAVQFIPDYVTAIELYRDEGNALQTPRDDMMPERVPEQSVLLVFENKRPWLCIFKPIMVHQNSSKIFGYVGLKLDFLTALTELNLFSHLDSSSISFIVPATLRVTSDNIINQVHVEELHYKELDQLKNVIYETFMYIVALVLAILFVLYWLIMALFARPLIALNKHIESIKHIPSDSAVPAGALNFSVNEFNNFAQSLHEYQSRLNLTQENLQKLNNSLEQRVIDRTAELQTINKELEAFSYSVSHDLRAPLRSIDGFSLALLEDYSDKLDEEGKAHLRRVRENSQRMAMLIDDLLNLARISRIEMQRSLVNMSDIAQRKVKQLQEQQPELTVKVIIAEDLYTEGDEQLLTILLNNLLGNAWKYSSKSPDPVIEFGRIDKNAETVFYVKDNGAGFDMKYVDKVFEVFQRLHGSDYEGTGVGLATVSRIVKRHSGRIWAEAEPGKGACFYFTLGSD